MKNHDQKNSLGRFALPALIFLMTVTTADAAQLFDFDGQAVGGAQVGEILTLHAVVTNGTQIEAPLPLDTVQFEYTIVITGITLDSSGNPDVFGPGTILLIEDASTPADYAAPGSFEDGTVILRGTLTGAVRTMFTSTLGTAVGNVDWNGGSRLDEIHPQDRISWSFLVNISRDPAYVAPGYDERWDGKLEPLEPIIPTVQDSWGRLKARF